MGWASGSELAQKIWDLFDPEYDQKYLAHELARLFEDADCDTLDECKFYRKYVLEEENE